MGSAIQRLLQVRYVVMACVSTRLSGFSSNSRSDDDPAAAPRLRGLARPVGGPCQECRVRGGIGTVRARPDGPAGYGLRIECPDVSFSMAHLRRAARSFISGSGHPAQAWSLTRRRLS